MNRYKEKLDSLEFSFSSLHQYEECPFGFYLNKVCDEEKESNCFAEIGKYGHELHEAIFKKQMSVQEALEDCVENFDNNVFSYISDSSREKKYIAMCDYFADFDESYEEKYEVIGVEKEFHWKIGRHKMVGYADLILKNKESKEVLLIDFKSAGHFMKKDGTPLKNQIDNFKSYSRQMYLYADAMKKEYGFLPDKIIWVHFLDNGEITSIPFNQYDYDSTIQWVKDTIAAIYKDKEFEARGNYMLCYQLCDFRNGTCDYKELRKLEDE